MKTLLRIDSSLRTEGSYSRNLGDFFVNEWTKKNTKNAIQLRDIGIEPIQHLDQTTLDCFYNDLAKTDLIKLSDKLISELFKADEILITVPMYNFGIPSSLKAYFDLIVRTGKTFIYDKKATGLLKNKKAYIITAMGDDITDGRCLVETHLQHILRYIGITEIHFFHVNGTANEILASKHNETQKLKIIKHLNQ